MSPSDEILTNQASGMSAAPLPSPFGPNDHGSLVFGSFVMFSFKTLKKNVALLVDSSTTPLQRFHPVNKYTLFPVILTCSVICMKPDKSRVVTELRDSAYDLHSSHA